MKTFVLYILIVLFLLVGCSVEPRVKLSKSQIITNNEARNIFINQVDFSNRINVVPVLLDRTYCMPSNKWIEWVATAYKRQQRAKRLVSWLPQFDCNRHARSFQNYCAEKYKQQSDKDWPEGIAVFLRAYNDKKIGPHAINTIIIENKQIKNWEPQENKWKDLSKQEINSSWYIGD